MELVKNVEDYVNLVPTPTLVMFVSIPLDYYLTVTVQKDSSIVEALVFLVSLIVLPVQLEILVIPVKMKLEMLLIVLVPLKLTTIKEPNVKVVSKNVPFVPTILLVNNVLIPT